MATAFEIEGSYKNTTAGGGDANFWYGGGSFAYPSISAALSVPPVKRQGLTVGILISGTVVEYWWPTSAIADADLVVKTTTGNYLPLAGGTMTGALLLSADPTVALQAVTKNYVDNLITGINWKQQVIAATTDNITLSGTQTIDDISLTENTRVLVKNQSNSAENGIYVVAAGAWTRSIDADTGAEIASAAVLVNQGTVNKDTQWTCTNSTAPVIGTDNIAFAQISGAGTYTNGAGILLTGNVFSIDAAYTANSSRAGYLSAADWSTFNSKIGFTSLTATAPVSYDSGTGIISIQSADATHSGIITTGEQTFAGNKTFNGDVAINNNLSVSNLNTGQFKSYNGIYFGGSQTGFYAGLDTFNFTNDRSFVLPDRSGSIALTDDLNGFFPTTGGALTGALSGTSGTFSSFVSVTIPSTDTITATPDQGLFLQNPGLQWNFVNNASNTALHLWGTYSNLWHDLYSFGLNGIILASGGFAKDGGTSSQFLKADGSVDSNTYLSSLNGAVLSGGSAGGQTITGGTSSGETLTLKPNLSVTGANSFVINDTGVTYGGGAPVAGVAYGDIKALTDPTASTISYYSEKTFTLTSAASITAHLGFHMRNLISAASSSINFSGKLIGGAVNNIILNGATGTILRATGLQIANTNSSGGLTITNSVGVAINALGSTVGITMNTTHLLLGTLLEQTGNWGINYQGAFNNYLGSGITELGQLKIDGISTYSSGGYYPVIWNTATQMVERLNGTLGVMQYTADKYVPVSSGGSGILAQSQIYDDGSFVGINYSSALSGYRFAVNGKLYAYSGLVTDGDFATYGSAIVDGDLNVHSNTTLNGLVILGGAEISGNLTIDSDMSVNNIDVYASINSPTFSVPGGTSLQFLKANGTLDNNTYATTNDLNAYIPYTGAINNLDVTGYQVLTTDLICETGVFKNGAHHISLQAETLTNNYNITLPAKSGTVALLSDITGGGGLPTGGADGQVLGLYDGGVPVWQNKSTAFAGGYQQERDGSEGIFILFSANAPETGLYKIEAYLNIETAMNAPLNINVDWIDETGNGGTQRMVVWRGIDTSFNDYFQDSELYVNIPPMYIKTQAGDTITVSIGGAFSSGVYTVAASATLVNIIY